MTQNIKKTMKKKDVDIYETLVFSWIMMGMSKEWNELEKAKKARELLKGLKKEWLALHDQSLRKNEKQIIIKELSYWASFFEDKSMNALTPSERLRERIDDLLEKEEK